MPFDYEGAKAAGYSDAEINSFLSQIGATRPAPLMPPPPTNIPYSGNLGASQKFQEGYNAEAGKASAEQIPVQQSKGQVLSGLDELESSLDYMNQHGGMNKAYDLPGLTPVVQSLAGAGKSDGIFKGLARGMGENVANRQVYKSNVGMLAAQLKKVVRGAGEGTWTDYDQQFLMSILPSGGDYNTDKRIIAGLRDGSLLNQIQEYRNKNNIGEKAVALPNNSAAKPQGVVDYREFFK